jgi:hypothetical protein
MVSRSFQESTCAIAAIAFEINLASGFAFDSQFLMQAKRDLNYQNA